MLCQQGQDRRQYRLICPCVPLCRAAGVVAGKGNIRRICRDFGRRKKEDIWSRHLQGETLADAKNACRRKAGAELPAKSLKSPQCGDFLPAPVKKDWRSFACCETEKEKIVLGASGFVRCAGTDAMERKEHFYERRIPKTAIYRVAV